MVKIDLHTHSIISQDGGITSLDYENAFRSHLLDCIAITDHNDISFALKMHRKLGDAIIVGEEISTQEGEVIGLFLSKAVPKGQSVFQTVSAIKSQGGLVYIPHPFEQFRQGLKQQALMSIAKQIDIIETFNGRGRLRSKEQLSVAFAKNHALTQAASSDAHTAGGLGCTYSSISEIPKVKTLVSLLESASLNREYAPLLTYIYPSINKIKHRFGNSEKY